MAKRLRHYNGQFGTTCPDGWRRVEVGETVENGDRMWFGGSWNDVQLPGGEVSPDYHLHIRRINPAPVAAPVAEAPANVGVPCSPDGDPVGFDVPQPPAEYRFATADDYARPKPDSALYCSADKAWATVYDDGTYHGSCVYALLIADQTQDADAPAECAECAECARLRAELDAATRRIESEQACRQIAETACVSAEKACAFHQAEADKARAERAKAFAERDEARQYLAAARAELEEANRDRAKYEYAAEKSASERDAAIVVFRVLMGRT